MEDIAQYISDWAEIKRIKRDMYFDEIAKNLDPKDIPRCQLITFAQDPLYMELHLDGKLLGSYRII
jgi:hypothetical protein